MQHIKVGDEVVRNMHGITMTLKVTAIDDKLIYCGPWTFDKKTGFEIDEDCSGTVSFIMLKDSDLRVGVGQIEPVTNCHLEGKLSKGKGMRMGYM